MPKDDDIIDLEPEVYTVVKKEQPNGDDRYRADGPLVQEVMKAAKKNPLDRKDKKPDDAEDEATLGETLGAGIIIGAAAILLVLAGFLLRSCIP